GWRSGRFSTCARLRAVVRRSKKLDVKERYKRSLSTRKCRDSRSSRRLVRTLPYIDERLGRLLLNSRNRLDPLQERVERFAQSGLGGALGLRERPRQGLRDLIGLLPRIAQCRPR